MQNLEKRSERILSVIVTEYINSGEPVGSRTISKRRDIALSAASIRNIMSDLTDLGYIMQPHVSSGRVPTDLGYRFYVNTLLKTRPGLPQEQLGIESALNSYDWNFKSLLKQSSSVLAGFCKQASVAASTLQVEESFKTIEFIKISDDRILVILVSTAGTVQNKIIYDEDSIKQDTLERYSRILNDILKDLDLHQARQRIEKELATEKAQFDKMLAKALKLCHVILSMNDLREVFVNGQINILDEPEFAQIEKLKSILSTFEDKSRLLSILDKTLMAEGIQIIIGSENEIDEMEPCSLVAYPIKTEGKVVGSIGVIGPKRMNYGRVIAVVDSTAQIVTQLMKKVVESAT